MLRDRVTTRARFNALTHNGLKKEVKLYREKNIFNVCVLERGQYSNTYSQKLMLGMYLIILA